MTLGVSFRHPVHRLPSLSPDGGLHVADMATHWRRPTAQPIVTVAELLGRVTAVPRGAACTPAMCQHEPGVSVDALLRREGRRSATPDGGSPGHTRRAAVAVSTFLAAGLGRRGRTEQQQHRVRARQHRAAGGRPTGRSERAGPGRRAEPRPGQQAPILDIPASTGALAAGSGPSTDWTAVAFPPTAGSGADDPSAASAETSDTSADASGDDASKSDADLWQRQQLGIGRRRGRRLAVVRLGFPRLRVHGRRLDPAGRGRARRRRFR